MKRITVIGGGTGTFVTLSGLKEYPYHLSVIVTTIDSGGSTGKLRDQYGVLPPGDLRQCLVALSDAPEIWRKLFLYRFDQGDFRGHNFGNVFLTALEKISPDYKQVIDMASHILHVQGDVIPVTFDDVHLCAEYQDGETIVTEDLIDTAFHKKTPIKKAYLKPRAKANKDALKAIEKTEYIIFGPGDMYTSLIPNVLVDGMQSALKKTKARIVYIPNLMTKRGQTTNYTASQHVQDLERYIGRKVDILVMNDAKIDEDVIAYYEQHGEMVVEDDVDNTEDYSIMRTDLLTKVKHAQTKSDIVMRSILRHDSLKVAQALNEIIGTS